MDDDQSSIRKDNIFDLVAQNSIDFLINSLDEDEINKKTKYSIINFSAGIELLLKARLIHEHWSLVIIGEPNFQSFKDGNARTLNFKALLPQIKSAIDGKIPHYEKTKNALNKLADHRNKWIHFYHESCFSSTTGVDLDVIIADQFLVWFLIKELIDDEWSNIFHIYRDKIAEIHHQISYHEKYLSIKYDQLKPKINQEIANGAKFTWCSICGHPSFKAIKTERTAFLFHGECLVCHNDDVAIMLDCPGCKYCISLFQGELMDNIFCKGCNSELNVKMAISTEVYDPKEGNHPINCAQCWSHDSVVVHDEGYCCCNCFFDDDDCQECEFCYERVIGDSNLEGSFILGYSFCDGRGVDKD